MIISDINYLEMADQETDVVGGDSGFSFRKKIRTDVKVRLDIKKRVLAKVKIKGNLADAEAYADAYGDDSLAETLTVAYADDYSSSAYSDSVAAVR